MCTGTHPFIPFEDVVEARMQYNTNGGKAENVFHFYREAGWLIDNMNDLATALHNWFTTVSKGHVSSDISLEQIVITELSTATSFQIIYTTGLPEFGTAEGEGLPSNVTAAIGFRTATRGRSARGRAFHIGLTVEMISGDTLLPDIVTDLKNIYADLRAGEIAAIDAVQVVTSMCHAGVWREVGSYVVVESTSCEPTLDSQRRRLAGRGL